MNSPKSRMPFRLREKTSDLRPKDKLNKFLLILTAQDATKQMDGTQINIYHYEWPSLMRLDIYEQTILSQYFRRNAEAKRAILNAHYYDIYPSKYTII